MPADLDVKNEKDLPPPQVSVGRDNLDYSEEVQPHEEQTHRALKIRCAPIGLRLISKARQISMIALGGAIGTGLVIGSGTALARSGPGSLFIAYCMVGLVCYALMVALGEMSTQFPTKKGFAGHATRFVDEAFGFTVALSYLCKYLVVSAFQIVAGALIIQYWNRSINPAVWCTISIGVVLAINILGVRYFGEVEFWLSFLKIITLTGMILLGFIISLGGVPGQDRIGFAYWQNGKAFKEYKAKGDVGKFLGFVNALVNALFAFMGTELVGVTVGEAKNPRKTVPSAIKKTFFRIVFFYIGSILVIGMTVDSTSSILAQANAKGTAGGASASPFVVAIQSAGIQTLPSIINAMLYMFTVSASNSDQYIATRTLYSMAMNGNAPRVFKTCNKRGAPWVAFAFTGSFMGLSFLVASSSALTVFNYLASTVTLFAALAWISIFASHIAFMRGMKAQGIPRSTLVYRSPLQPYLTYYGMFMTLVISVFKGFDAFMPFNLVNFITNYIAVPVYVFGYIGYKLARRTKYVRVHEMDLNNNGAEFDDIVVDEVEEELLSRMNWRQRIWHHIKNW